MTRIEEIEQQASLTVFPWDEPQEQNKFQDGFIEGAKWADKIMIEKACEYLRQSLYNTPIFENDKDETPVNYVCASCCDSVEEFVGNFRKAMEE